MKRKRFTYFDGFIAILSLGIALAVLLGIWAGTWDPVDYPYYAFFGLSFPFSLFFFLILMLYWLIRKQVYILIAFCAILIYGYVPMRDSIGLWGNTGEDKKSAPEHIRMLTYNVHSFSAYGEHPSKESLSSFYALLKLIEPDVVCFQEFYTRKEGVFDTIDSLKTILKTPYVYFEPTMSAKKNLSGLAIFSKYPIQDSGLIQFEDSKGNSSIYADVLVGERALRIYNVHLQSISFNREDYDYIDQVGLDMEMAQIAPTKRILSMLKKAFQKRSRQVKVMKAHMRTSPIPFIIAGDFNDTPASYAVQQLTDSLHNAFEKKGWGLGRTYNGKFPNFQIDYIASSPELQVENYKIIKEKLSDHFPVRADFTWNEQ